MAKFISISDLRLTGFLVLVYVTFSQASFNVNVDQDGMFKIAVDGITWLTSGKTFFNNDGQRWSVGGIDGSELVKVNITVEQGQTWNETRILYTTGNHGDTMATYIRTFPAQNRIIFTQQYITGARNTSIKGQSSYNTTIGGFPCIQIADAEESLGFLSYGGYMLGFTDMTSGTFDRHTTQINDGMNYGPLALFNKAGKSIVMSPYDNFMSASMWQDLGTGHIAWGIMGGVNTVPANFTYRTIFQYDNSINKAFLKWGQTLRDKVGSDINNQREQNFMKDKTLNYLGYWTDNGAYYYYTTEPDKNYEPTLIDVKTNADQRHIPYRYLQLDSWWYPKENDSRGVLSWTPLPDLFPRGLLNLSQTTGWKYLAHNRYWSKMTPYAKQNNGSYNFIVEDGGALPNDLEFWRYLLKQAKGWGLQVYEQDWLNRQTMYLTALQSSLTLGRDWLTQMGQAATENGLTIQYCMAMTRHALQSLEIPAVTQARVSDDFLFKIRDQWRIGVTSIFANAINLRPCKDTFWTTSVQPQNRYGKSSPYPAIDAVVASLSRGPVGPGDRIGYTNTSLLMRCCRSDGLLLQPSRPALAVDKQIIMKAFDQTLDVEIWTTHSTILSATGSSMSEYGILFATDVTNNVTVTMADLNFDTLQSGVYYPYNDFTQWKYFNSTSTIDLTGCTKANFCLYYISPFITGSSVTAILGDSSKWVPMSSDRIQQTTHDVQSVTMTMSGVPGETVTMSYIMDGQLQSTSCNFVFNTTQCVLSKNNNMASSTKHDAVVIIVAIFTASVSFIGYI